GMGSGDPPRCSHRSHAWCALSWWECTRQESDQGKEEKKHLTIRGSAVGPSLWTGQATRALSTARLSVLPRVHLPPIDVVVSHGPSGAYSPGRIHLGRGFPLRCIQRFS